jgi:hypothetical protein
MRIPDDERPGERFESYLKRFRPISAEPLPSASVFRQVSWFRVGALASALTIVVLTISSSRFSQDSRSDSLRKPDNSGQGIRRPLTLRDANSLLAKSSSFKVAIDQVARSSGTPTLASRERSALAELSKEKDKL